MKVMTILGTRPEIIRLSLVLPADRNAPKLCCAADVPGTPDVWPRGRNCLSQASSQYLYSTDNRDDCRAAGVWIRVIWAGSVHETALFGLGIFCQWWRAVVWLAGDCCPVGGDSPDRGRVESEVWNRQKWAKIKASVFAGASIFNEVI